MKSWDLGSIRIRPIKNLGPLQSEKHGASLPSNLRKLRGDVPDYHFAQVKGKPPVAPEVRSEKSCMLGKGKPGLRACHAELIFLGESRAASYGVKPGAYLQFCTKPKQRGLVIPVKSHQEASEIASRYCRCLGSGKPDKGKRESCARTSGAEQATKRSKSKRRR